MKKLLIITGTILIAWLGIYASVHAQINVNQGGTGKTNFPPNSIITTDGNAFQRLQSTSSNPLTVGSLIGTTTATSTFGGGFSITTGCFAIGSTCVSGSGGSSSAFSYLFPQAFNGTSSVLTLNNGFNDNASTSFSAPVYIANNIALEFAGGSGNPTDIKAGSNGDFLFQTGTNQSWFTRCGIDQATKRMAFTNNAFNVDLFTVTCGTGNATVLGALTVSTTTASSTFANGINLTGGCITYQNGACLGTGSGGGGSGTVNAGVATQLAFYNTSGTAVSGSSTDSLTVGRFVATSTTATSTFAGDMMIGTSTGGFTSHLTIRNALNTANIIDVHNNNDVSVFTMSNGGLLTTGAINSGDINTFGGSVTAGQFLTTGTTPGAGGLENTNAGVRASVYFPDSNTIGFGTNSLEIGRFTATALGIGTTSPGTTLSVQGNAVIANYVDASKFVATSTTASSTFAGGVDVARICLTGTTTCLSAAGGGSGTVGSGVAGQLAFYNSSGTAVVGSSSASVTAGVFFATSTTATSTNAGDFIVGSGASAFKVDYTGFVGIGSSTPYAQLSVVGSGGIVADKIFATSTASSTFAGGVDATRVCLKGTTTCLGTPSGRTLIGAMGTTSGNFLYNAGGLQYPVSTTTPVNIGDTLIVDATCGITPSHPTNEQIFLNIGNPGGGTTTVASAYQAGTTETQVALLGVPYISTTTGTARIEIDVATGATSQTFEVCYTPTVRWIRSN